VQQTERLQALLPNWPVRFGMMIGNPPLGETVRQMIAEGVTRLIALPMFPQYSATTSASATDVLFRSLMRERRVPALRVVPPYFDHPAYLDAMTAVIQEDLGKLQRPPGHLVVSFHGIPQKYAQRGDPYATQVVRTTRGLIARLGLKRDQWTQTYQSRFGKSPWLKPYTDDVLAALARKGVKDVAVALPGFTADCLETLDEIGHESAEVFRRAGGEKLHAIPCLNSHPRWIDAMARIIRDEAQGWL
jgi:ferrochelatase